MAVDTMDFIGQCVVTGLHHREPNADVDTQRGRGPRVVKFPSLKGGLRCLEFVMGQPAPRTTMIISAWRPSISFFYPG